MAIITGHPGYFLRICRVNAHWTGGGIDTDVCGAAAPLGRGIGLSSGGRTYDLNNGDLDS